LNLKKTEPARRFWLAAALLTVVAATGCTSTATCDVGGSRCVDECFRSDLPSSAVNDCVRRCDRSTEACRGY